MVDGEAVEAAIRVRDANRDLLMSKANVTGTDIGFRYVAGEVTDTVAIRVFVSEKSDVDDADAVPAIVDGIPTDVIETAPLRLEADVRDERNPLVGGISVGPLKNDKAGTLGVVMQGADGTLYGLTNFHVLASVKDISVGETVTQPARGDHPWYRQFVRSFHWVGAVAKFQFGPVDPDDRTSFSTDAALFTLTREVLDSIEGIGRVHGSGSPVLGAKVIKCGRSTGVTHGVIEGIRGERPTGQNLGDLEIEGIGTEHMRPVLTVKSVKGGHDEFTDKGDSGCVYVDEETRLVVGLHMASAALGDTRYSVGTHMPDLERHFGVSVFVAPPSPPFTLSVPFRPVSGTTGDEWASDLIGLPYWRLTIGSHHRQSGWITSRPAPDQGHAVEIRGPYGMFTRTLYVCVSGAPDGMLEAESRRPGGLFELERQAWTTRGFKENFVPSDIAGHYWYRFVATGKVQTAGDAQFRVTSRHGPFRLWVGRRAD